MQKPAFSIPDEFCSELRHAEILDERSDEEILDSLSKPVPVTSEKNVWAYWHSGVESMPCWNKRNVVNWIRLCGPSWAVRVLDNIPDSPNYALKWITPEALPETFVEGTMDGPYTGQHSADFLRCACLVKYGGVWMDVSIILVRRLEDICWRQLEDPESPYEVSLPWLSGTFIFNAFIACRKGNFFVKRWHELFVHLWKDRTNCVGLTDNPLMSFGKKIRFEDPRARRFPWDFKVKPVVFMEYLGQLLAWQRLCTLKDPIDGFNGPEYYETRVLLFDSLSETWGAEEIIGFSGQDVYDILTTRTDIDPDSPEYQKAYKTIWRLLTRSSMQKIVHGKGMTKAPTLGILLDENDGDDATPGTFAELLRYGSVRFEQKRREIEYVKAPKPLGTIKTSLL